MNRTFDKIIGEIKTALKASQGADRTVIGTDANGRNIEVRAFIAGGNVAPGSFRSTWWIDGVKMSKSAAAKELIGK